MSKESPFSVVLNGKTCNISLVNEFSVEKKTRTYVISATNIFQNPASLVAIGLSPGLMFEDDQGATISANTTRGVTQGDFYWVGSLSPTKLGCFARIGQMEQEVDGLVFYIAVRPKRDVDRYVKEANEGLLMKGPFTELT